LRKKQGEGEKRETGPSTELPIDELLRGKRTRLKLETWIRGKKATNNAGRESLGGGRHQGNPIRRHEQTYPKRRRDARGRERLSKKETSPKKGGFR